MPAYRNNTTMVKRSTVHQQKDFSDLSVIIPAAGMGHRMKSYGPKALISANKTETIIEKQIKTIWKTYPGCEIFIVVGFNSEKIKEKLKGFPVRFIENPVHETTNVLYSLGIAAQASINKKMMIVYGDLIFNQAAIKNLVGDVSGVVVDSKGMMDKREVGVVVSNNMVMNLAFGLEQKWCQIAFLTGKELSIFKEISTMKENSQWFGYEAMNKVLEMSGRLHAFSQKGIKIVEIDVVKDLNKIKK